MEDLAIAISSVAILGVCRGDGDHHHPNYGDYDVAEKGWNIRLHDDGRKSCLQVKRGRG